MTIKNSTFAALAALFIIVFIDSMGWGLVFPILEPIVINNANHMFSSISLAERNFYYEFLIAIYCVFMFMGAPLLGVLSDRYGRKVILIISMLGAVCGYAFCALGAGLSSFALLTLGRVISGSTAGSFPIAQAAMVDISSPEELPKRLGLAGIASGIGFAFGPVIGGFFLDPNIFRHVEYPLPFIFSGFVALLGALLTYFMFHETYQGNKQQKMNWLTGFKNVYKAFSVGKCQIYFLSYFFSLLAYTFFFCVLPLLLGEKLGQDGSHIGYFMTYFTSIFTIGLMVIFPWCNKRFSLQRLVLFGLTAQILLFFVFVFINHVVYVWIIGGLVALVEPYTYIGLTSLISYSTQEDQQGQMMGVLGSLAALTWGIGPLLTGIVVKTGLATSFMLAVVVAAIGSIIFMCRKLTIQEEI